MLIFRNKKVIKDLDFKFFNTPKSIIMGHSHPQCAFDDKFINNFYNLSSSGSTLFYTYIKLRVIIKYNPDIKNIFIEFGNLDIEKSFFDSATIELDKGQALWSFSLFNYLMEVEDYCFLIKKRPLNIYYIFLRSPIKQLGDFFTLESKFSKYSFGRFSRLKNSSLTKKFLEKTNKYKHCFGKEYMKKFEISEDELIYLDKIINLCKIYKKHIFFVKSPIHSSCLKLFNENIYQKILNKRFFGINLLDFSSFPLLDDEFADLEHLNYKGARKFSFWFNEMMKKGLLEKKDKQKFIDEEMEILKIKKH